MNTMKDGMIVEQRDIILIPFPFSNLSISKKRPVLVISNSKYNKQNQDIICCAITSNLNNKKNSINITKNDMVFGKLNYQSKIKPDKIFTIEKNLILRKLCKINKRKCIHVITKLNSFLSIEKN